MKLTSIAALAATAIFASTLVNAQGPAVGPALNVDPNYHPQLAAAQQLSRQAWQKIADARDQANDWDKHGYAQKAMDMLVIVNNEIAAAAEKR